MKLLVTGSAGFVGLHLVEKLLIQGHQVCGIDNFDLNYAKAKKERNISTLKSYPHFRFYDSDLLDLQATEKILKEENVDVVIHLAGKEGVEDSSHHPLEFIDGNIKATVSLCEAMKKNGIKKLIFGSSACVYGATQVVPFREDDLCEKILSIYGMSKLSAEKIVKLYHLTSQFSVLILRLFSGYGPWQRPDQSIFRLTYALLTDRPIEINGDGKVMRDYTYIDDLTDGMLKGLQRMTQSEADKPLNEIYNLALGKPISTIELISYLEKITEKKANIIYRPAVPGELPVTFADISRAQRILQFAPQVDIEQGLTKFKNWMIKEIL